MIDEKLLKSEEKAILALRSLYRKYGYLPYKMSKFEEYELYVRNKDFLVSDRIITFNDTNGKLLALKPDVTLSIIRNGEDVAGVKQKVYYNENVYRVSDSTHQYKEIMQAGLECIGDIDIYDIFEVLNLAAMSLSVISDDFILEISHLDILSAVLDGVCGDKLFQKKAIGYISEKNAHDLCRLCAEYGVDSEDCNTLCTFISAYGNRDKVLDAIRPVCMKYAPEAFENLRVFSLMLDELEYSDKIILDFSVVNDMSYYNGIAFKGFLMGVCGGVLSGGRYDNMMKKMDRTSGAVGFALYLDMLEQLPTAKTDHDVDVLLLYGDSDDKAAVAAAVKKITENGKTVSAQKSVPEKLRYTELVKMGGSIC